MSEVRLVGFVGSLRTGSVNAAVARGARRVLPEGSAMTIHDVAQLPLYDGDIEADGPPDHVVALHSAVEAADGLVFFSPEYNTSLPAVTKNVIDWLSRPPRSWENTAVTIVSATPGRRAGLGVRTHFEQIMGFMPVRPFEGFGIGTYGEKLDETGELVDPETLDALADHLARFALFCREVTVDDA